jgi:opacity protein-like surface antigen
MKKTILLAGSLMAISMQGAFAADFGGLYGGITLADTDYRAAWFDRDYYDHGGTVQKDDRSASYGIQFGFNSIHDTLLLGAEFGYQGFDSDISSYHTSSSGPVYLYNNEISNLYSLKLRAGLVQGATLFYLTAGVALTDEEHQSIDPSGPANNTTKKFESGRPMTLIGVGLEHMVSDNFSVRAEYQQGSGQETDEPILNSISEWEVTTDIRQFGLSANLHF